MSTESTEAVVGDVAAEWQWGEKRAVMVALKWRPRAQEQSIALAKL